ncbi:MAG: glutamine-hydrolyzing carbamoyl-phosphate synthase small subunit [bacterium]|nr:glutamine-hydrolyzing carbamoyl-phosphate synthase small subunit [bacterium]
MIQESYSKALLVLEDGTVFRGRSFGAEGEVSGEVVFNTSMTGYQEVITDPSYNAQMIAFTYPLIGNYGVNSQDVESDGVKAKAMIVRDYVADYSNWRAEMSLGTYLKNNNVVGICEVDTRAITRHIRNHGAMKCVVSTLDSRIDSLIKKAQKDLGLIGRNLVKEVTCKMKYIWSGSEGHLKKVVVMDYGVKYNILRMLAAMGIEVHVMPANTSASEVLALNPDGVMLSNGPGDPRVLTEIVAEVKKMIGKVPIFGICLGHQLIGQALGATISKLKFGHRGGNHPVKDLETGKVEITSQNHGFCVDIDSVNEQEIEITHINLYDNTLEGMKHKVYPLFSVQYHPEAYPGPHDSSYLLRRFCDLM